MSAPAAGTAANMGRGTPRAGCGAFTLAALGVAYGDVGTSPLYTLREAFGYAGGLHLGEGRRVRRALAVFWSLLPIVTLKYVVLILRADNCGEGGVLALGNLRRPGGRRPPPSPAGAGPRPLAGRAGPVLRRRPDHPGDLGPRRRRGAGDRRPRARAHVVPLAVLVLLALSSSSRGTASVGRLFGPVMLAWFAALGLLGLAQIARNLGVLAALNPLRRGPVRARRLAGVRGPGGDRAGGSPGRRRSTPTWATSAAPRSASPGSASCCPAWCSTTSARARCSSASPRPRRPVLPPGPRLAALAADRLATLATIIASQAVISGVFSLTRQAIRLGHLPRMTVRHTSAPPRSARSTSRA